MTTLEIDPLSVRLGEVFAEAGRELFLVGGSVRDRLIGRDAVGDLDYATSAKPDETRSLLGSVTDAVYRQGEKFGTIGARVGGRRVEVTTYRSERYVDESRNPEVKFDADLEGDLLRRDFTLNAMALDAATGELVDPFGGVIALREKRLDTPLYPSVTFEDDPLRMLRAARFIAEFGLTPAVRVLVTAGECRVSLGRVSRERVSHEIARLLVAPHVGAGLTFLDETKLLDEALPSVAALRMERDDEHRHKDVLAHTFAVVERTEPDLILRLAALLHDVGKPETRRFEGGRVSFHGHDAAGARIAKRQLRDLKWPVGTIDAVSLLVGMHLRFHSFKEGWSDSAVRRYVRDAGRQLDRLNALVRADCTTQKAGRAAYLSKQHDRFEAELVDLVERENLGDLRPALNGNEIMALLGCEPGPVVGDARKLLIEVRMERGEISRVEAAALVRKWYDEYLADRSRELARVAARAEE